MKSYFGFASPFEQIPYSEFIQSPVGLVPKDGGNDTRLIFHLSYPRNGSSINSETPPEICSVKYPDFSEAIRICMLAGPSCKMGKSDFRSTFRNLRIKPEQFKLLVMMAIFPVDKKPYFFIGKCLPFGASISCSHFQRFSNAIAFLVTGKIQRPLINYLDDYFFTAIMKLLCDVQIQQFLDLCKEVNFPVSLEKMFWGSTLMTFLGFLIDSVHQTISVPADKIERAIILIQNMLNG